MHRALPLSAVLAWVMIQVPVVLCGTGCGDSVCSLILAGDHACHDLDSAVHLQCCAASLSGGADSLDAHVRAACLRGDRDHHEGGHVVVQIQSAAGSAAVGLPGIGDAVEPWSSSLQAPGVGAIRRSGDPDRSGVEPPPCADPVSRADQRQV